MMTNTRRRILWADDEIDMLRPHILYLQGKGFEVVAVSNGEDALQLAGKEHFDAVLLDEMMPGLGGLAVLESLQSADPGLPVIMVTKSEEENLMDRALGRRISDYLTKPVNPSQVFLAIKKVLESEALQRTQKTRDYVAEYNRLLSLRHGDLDWRDWLDLYRGVVDWDLELRGMQNESLLQAHLDQKVQLNREFGRFVESHYREWAGKPRSVRPPLSVDVFSEWLLPHLQAGRRLALVVIDCMRLDQWRMLEPLVAPYFEVRTEHYYAILPTATPYARNAIFSGLYPKEIHERHPDWWLEDAPKEAGRNRYEKELMEEQLKRHHLDADTMRYQKIYTEQEGSLLRRKVGTWGDRRFLAFVFNFLDMLAHGQSESEILHELAPDEEALRRLLQSWFQHSVLLEVLRILSRQNTIVVVTSDHGLVHCRRPSVVLGNRETSTSIRYKFGDNLVCDENEAIHVRKPDEFMLPLGHLNKQYVMARENFFFVYPTNQHHYERQFRGTFQHGGISLEEMVLPVATLIPRSVEA
jgi:CheY-like chemotaxis protein